MEIAFYKSPLGYLEIKAQDGALVSVGFVNSIPSPNRQRLSSLLNKACQQLDEYFAGKRKNFNLPLEPLGTSFQQKVWQEIQNIEYAKTKTYAEIACQIGKPKACRAVGQANNKNPIAIIIPCHRVIGKSGKLTGYAAGLEIKQKLLLLEQENK